MDNIDVQWNLQNWQWLSIVKMSMKTSLPIKGLCCSLHINLSAIFGFTIALPQCMQCFYTILRHCIQNVPVITKFVTCRHEINRKMLSLITCVIYATFFPQDLIFLFVFSPIFFIFFFGFSLTLIIFLIRFSLKIWSKVNNIVHHCFKVLIMLYTLLTHCLIGHIKFIIQQACFRDWKKLNLFHSLLTFEISASRHVNLSHICQDC